MKNYTLNLFICLIFLFTSCSESKSQKDLLINSRGWRLTDIHAYTLDGKFIKDDTYFGCDEDDTLTFRSDGLTILYRGDTCSYMPDAPLRDTSLWELVADSLIYKKYFSDKDTTYIKTDMLVELTDSTLIIDRTVIRENHLKNDKIIRKKEIGRYFYRAY